MKNVKVRSKDVKVRALEVKESDREEWKIVIYLWWRSFKSCVCAILFLL